MSKREDVLSALFAAVQSVPGVDLCERNRADAVPHDTRTALVLMDGDISADLGKQTGRGRESVLMLTAQPIVWAYVERPQSCVGADLDALILSTIKTVLSDAALQAAVGSNGTVKVAGTEGALNRGAQTLMAAGIQFAITFPEPLV